MTCKHRGAYPTIYTASKAGYMWCSDCGAIREIIADANTCSFKYMNKKGWLLPKGRENVLKQLERGRG